MALDWNYFPERFLKSAVIPLEQSSKIPGNGSAETKHWVANVLSYFCYTGKNFANSVGSRVEIIEISINHKSEDPMRLEGRVVCEIETQEDMLNPSGNMHGGCTAYLIDICTALPLVALDLSKGGSGKVSYSSALHVWYHSPARLGDKVRLVCTTITIGARVESTQCEVWNVTGHRLVATGTQVKMSPPVPKAKTSKPPEQRSSL